MDIREATQYLESSHKMSGGATDYQSELILGIMQSAGIDNVSADQLDLAANIAPTSSSSGSYTRDKDKYHKAIELALGAEVDADDLRYASAVREYLHTGLPVDDDSWEELTQGTIEQLMQDDPEWARRVRQAADLDEYKKTGDWETYLLRFRSHPDYDDMLRNGVPPDQEIPDEIIAHVEERNASIRKELERAKNEPQPDAFEPGYYEVQDGRIVRVGEAEPLTRYHGTSHKSDDGEVITEFRAQSTSWDSLYRPSINDTPALYTTDRPSLTQRYGDQLYTLRVSPRVHVNLDDCMDDKLAFEAIRRGADVIDCPRYWEQPETLVLDPSIMETQSVEVPTRSGQASLGAVDVELLPEGVEQHDDRLFRYIRPEPLPSDHPALRDAIADYKDAESRRHNYRQGKAVEYQSMAKEPTYTKYGGRGRLR